MDKLETKQRIIDKLHEEVNLLKENFEGQFKRNFQEAADQVDEQASYDEGGFWDVQAEENAEKMSIYEKQMESLGNAINKLNQKQVKLEDSVAFGNVVHTNNGNFFVCFAFEPLKIDGVKFIPIAKSAPIYEVLQGRRKGEKFQFRDKTFEILDVY
ncbi:hypothetical protein V6R21_13070 [Limibacter armeniacum]|uniref:hypothetical protein n=1 Tax=Limibacter armeniacum TaxID=466084 RepID=UPI002FE592E3